MSTFDKTILVTGGAGFIGSHVIRLFVNKYPNYKIVNGDALTYAGNLENLKPVEHASNYLFEKADIQDADALERIFEKHGITDVIHLAAESHVDRSITDPLSFVKTNVFGTVNLLNAAKKYWAGKLNEHLFYHVSTDEVYGSLHDGGFFLETTPYDPQSPYSASKAASDHFVNAFYHTYGLPVKLSNCSNNYGSHHFPEKLIPLIIARAIHNIEAADYTAALALDPGRRARVFYLVRAVTPGTYTVPPSLVEDMYRPQLRGVGRSNPSTITVVQP